MNAFERLHYLLNTDDSHHFSPVAYDVSGKPITFETFKKHIRSATNFLAQTEQQRFLLHSNNAFYFLVAFIALLANQKTILLSANIQPQWLQDIEQQFDGFIGDDKAVYKKAGDNRSVSLNKKHLSFSELLNNTVDDNNITFQINPLSPIVFFTSGSTEKPKAVHKNLGQLLGEIDTLEQAFNLPENAHIISSVSQQHIYGLLFRLLWPFIYNRSFNSEIIEYPEQLTDESLNSIRPQSDVVLITSPAFLSRLDSELQYLLPTNIFSSGGPLNFNAAQQTQNLLSNYPIEVYGSTETGGIAYRQQKNIGQPWQLFNDVMIVQKNNQSFLSSIFLAQDTLLLDDQIEMIDKRSFHLKGRLDKVVKIEEKRISLNQLEQYLLSHQWVKSVKVIVLQQQRQILAAIVELEDIARYEITKSITQQLRNFCLQKFEPITIPRKWRYVKQMPYNSQGKLSYLDLEKLFMQDIS